MMNYFLFNNGLSVLTGSPFFASLIAAFTPWKWGNNHNEWYTADYLVLTGRLIFE